MEAVDGLRPRASPPVAHHHRLLTSPVTPFPTRVVRGADTDLEENRLAVLQMPKACFREKLNLLPGKFHLRLDLAMVRQTSRSRHICPATTSRRVKTRGRRGRRNHRWLGRRPQGQQRRRRRVSVGRCCRGTSHGSSSTLRSRQMVGMLLLPAWCLFHHKLVWRARCTAVSG